MRDAALLVFIPPNPLPPPVKGLEAYARIAAAFSFNCLDLQPVTCLSPTSCSSLLLLDLFNKPLRIPRPLDILGFSLPKHSAFLMSRLESVSMLLAFVSTARFNLVVMDPPWYSTLPHPHSQAKQIRPEIQCILLSRHLLPLPGTTTRLPCNAAPRFQ